MSMDALSCTASACSSSSSSPVPTVHRYQHRPLTPSAYTTYLPIPPPPPHNHPPPPPDSDGTSFDPTFAAANPPSSSSGPQQYGYVYLPAPPSATYQPNHDTSNRPPASSHSHPVPSPVRQPLPSLTGGVGPSQGWIERGIKQHAKANEAIEGGVGGAIGSGGHPEGSQGQEKGVGEGEGSPNDELAEEITLVKTRRRTTRLQFTTLEEQFHINPKPASDRRQALSEQLDMTPRGVQIWFQNRRAKAKNKAKKEATSDTSAAAPGPSSTTPTDSPFVPSVRQAALPTASSLPQLPYNSRSTPANSQIHPQRSQSSASSDASPYRRDSVQRLSDFGGSHSSSSTSGLTNSPLLRWDPQMLPPPPNTKSRKPVAPPNHPHPQYQQPVYRPLPQSTSIGTRQSSRRSSAVAASPYSSGDPANASSSSEEVAATAVGMERRSSVPGGAPFHPYPYQHYRGYSTASSAHSQSSAGGPNSYASSSCGSPAPSISGAGMSRRGSLASLRSSASGGVGPERTAKRRGSNGVIMGEGLSLKLSGGALMARRGSVPHPSPLQLSRSNFSQFEQNSAQSRYPLPPHSQQQHLNNSSLAYPPPHQYGYDQQSRHFPTYPSDPSLLPAANVYSQPLARRSSVPASYHSDQCAPYPYPTTNFSPHSSFGNYRPPGPSTYFPDISPSSSLIPASTSSSHVLHGGGPSPSESSSASSSQSHPLTSSMGSGSSVGHHLARSQSQRELSPIEDSFESISPGFQAMSFAEFQFPPPSSSSVSHHHHPDQQFQSHHHPTADGGPSFVNLNHDHDDEVEDAQPTAMPFNSNSSSAFIGFEQQQQQPQAYGYERGAGETIQWKESFAIGGDGAVVGGGVAGGGEGYTFPAYDDAGQGEGEKERESNDTVLSREPQMEMTDDDGSAGGGGFGFDPNLRRVSATSEVLHNFSNMQFFPASGSLKERPPPDLYTLHESMDSSGGAGGAGGLVHDDDPTHTTIFSPSLSSSYLSAPHPITYQPHDGEDDDGGSEQQRHSWGDADEQRKPFDQHYQAHQPEQYQQEFPFPFQ